ncbi:hypothetical protein FEZ51_07185 [Pediococcus stilesii]|uniref:Acid-resistance membrane protein n=1 Tax=Pediococcus stilesii TaxID=331679 RepID=A0A5R9BVG1_9LACO|nr:DUF308 domain-containing protein [Pediococcus stilesii]TLQ03902.1 hypothetical protein FEZ51_07185 [Pediococcus stilesii]
MENRINKFDPFALVLGILFIVIAVMAFQNPLSTFGIVVIIAAIASLLVGMYKLFWIRPFLGNSTWLTFNAIFDIIIGLIMLFNKEFGMLLVTISLALMFLLDSITTLWLAKTIQSFSAKYYTMDIIISIIGIILGIVLLFSPIITVISISTIIALLFIIFGISLITHSF